MKCSQWRTILFLLLCSVNLRLSSESEVSQRQRRPHMPFPLKRKLGVKESLGEDKGEGFFEFKHQTDDQCVKNKVCITALDSYISGISLICGVRECTRKTEHALIHQSKTILLVICASWGSRERASVSVGWAADFMAQLVLQGLIFTAELFLAERRVARLSVNSLSFLLFFFLHAFPSLSSCLPLDLPSLAVSPAHASLSLSVWQ